MNSVKESDKGAVQRYKGSQVLRKSINHAFTSRRRYVKKNGGAGSPRVSVVRCGEESLRAATLAKEMPGTSEAGAGGWGGCTAGWGNDLFSVLVRRNFGHSRNWPYGSPVPRTVCASGYEVLRRWALALQQFLVWQKPIHRLHWATLLFWWRCSTLISTPKYFFVWRYRPS